MNRVTRLGGIFQHLCTIGFVVLGAATFSLGLALARSEYHAIRVIYLFNVNYSRLAIKLHHDAQSIAVVALLLWVLPWLAGLLVCRRIFGAFALGEGFKRSTTQGFRALAWVVWSSIPAAYLLSPSVCGLWRKLLMVLLTRSLFLGLALFLLAYIMEEACHLQAEQDLVV